MNLNKIFTDNRSVSPVIGVILMVAVTVILAAVIGAFVLGLGDQASNSAPQASFEFSFSENNVTITHTGGDNIPVDELDIVLGDTTLVEGEVYQTATDGVELGPNSGGWFGTITSGTSASVSLDPEEGDFETSGETLRVIWNNPSGGSSNTIAERQWP